MEAIEKISIIKTEEIIRVVSSALRMIDTRLIEHGERVAYIALEICKQGRFDNTFDTDKLFMLGLFHDIGAYKTEEIDKMLEFESNNVWNHSIYGYLFLKYMTPLKDYSESILYHHMGYERLCKMRTTCKEYAAILALADRIDVLIQLKGEKCDLAREFTNSQQRFCPAYVQLTLQADEQGKIVKNVMDGTFRETVSEIRSQLDIDVREGVEYLKMLVHSIDFRSKHTVSHTISTATIALEIARILQLDKMDCEKLYFGALLHDLGKMAIPYDILENSGKLTQEEMVIMRTHVAYTEEIIDGLVDDEVQKIAVRHHEKLDGKGYPYGLTESQLTRLEKILAVADIMSALVGVRSYKEGFSKNETVKIIKDMRDTGKLCKEICNIVIDKFDDILNVINAKQKPIIEMYHEISAEYEILLNKFAPAMSRE